MKNLIFLLVTIFSGSSFAGPSVSGGVMEAPWVRSHDIVGQVLRLLGNHTLVAITIIDSDTAVAQIICSSNKLGDIYFNIDDSASCGPIMCRPYRVVTQATVAKDICK